MKKDLQINRAIAVLLIAIHQLNKEIALLKVEIIELQHSAR